MASTVRLSLRDPDPDATDPERPPPALPSELLEEILLRVASPADLARAATACVSFRCIIADHAFHRSINPPLLLIDFFNWVHLVCDPLSRRYMLLPPITDDLLASIGIEKQHIFNFGASFIRSRGTDGDTSFSVISWIKSRSRLGVFIFSSGFGWSVSTSISWDDLGLDEVDNLGQEQCTSDCFYWKLNDKSRVVKLDLKSLQFCTIGLPPGHEGRDIVIVESGETGVAMFSSFYLCTSVDYYTFPQNGSEESHEWHLKSTIPLRAHYKFRGIIGGPAEGYIFMQCTPVQLDSAVLSLEIESFNIERVGRVSSSAWGVYPYFGFPPSMSPSRI